MNFFTWGVDALKYAEEIITGATVLLGAAGIFLGKARSVKKQLLGVLDASSPKNEELEDLARQRGLSDAAKEIGKLKNN